MQVDDRPVLIVDLANLFIRSYIVYPTMSSHGHQMGGCIGSLKSLCKLVTEVHPSAVYVVWEGGGSDKRRKIYPNYKLGRRPEKLNRFYGDDIPDSEENRQHQLLMLLSMLKCVPVCQLYVQGCEGDDVVAYLSRGPFRASKKVIASSDKDFYQLLDDNTILYSLHKKCYVSAADVLSEYSVSSNNFAIAKSLCGDRSDNIPGIGGVGYKTAAKAYPMLGSEQSMLLEDVISYASANIDESNVHKRVLASVDVVQRNYKLVYLDGGMLSATQAASIDHVISAYKPKIDRTGLIKKLVDEGVGDFDVDGFYYPFYVLWGESRHGETLA